MVFMVGFPFLIACWYNFSTGQARIQKGITHRGHAWMMLLASSPALRVLLRRFVRQTEEGHDVSENYF
jgi:hypothetical protein